MNRRITLILCIFLLITALGITLYPLISNIVGETYRSLVETQYEQAVAKLDDVELSTARKAAENYNRTLLTIPQEAYTRDALLHAEQSYNDLLNVCGDGIMGYVQIPKIDVELPIYHGTSEETLDRGIGHLMGSSLPIGGVGTHCVLTGHSGLAGNRMFSDLDQLKKGDVFYLKVLDETFAYAVLEIDTVLPEDTSQLAIDSVRDTVTLVTCTPFGVNTHRLLIHGERTEYHLAERVIQETDTPEAPVKSTWAQEYLKGIGIGCVGVFGLSSVIVCIRYGLPKLKERRGRHEKR